MYELSVKTHFSAAHRLVGYQGACANFHGHNWGIEIYLRGRDLNEIGILVDFREIKDAVKVILSELDHADLNQVPAFVAQNPTSENIARYLFQALSARLTSPRYHVSRVCVAESPGTTASYWNDNVDG